VLQLPEAANVPALLFTAQRAASSSRVSILAATRKDFASNTQTLGAAEISLSATGTYADLKAWLSRVLQEHPNAVLTHLVMARVSGTETTLRSDVTLTLLTKPMAHSNVLPAATAAATEPAPGNGQASQHP
jgi:Tfp pilus assembly protein PilO